MVCFAETKSKAVAVTQEESTPKRSRSIEGLASKSQSIESPSDVSAKETKTAVTVEASGQQAVQTARHFWQKKHTDKAVKSGVSKGEMKKKEDSAPSTSKPQLLSSTKENKSGSTKLQDKSLEISSTEKSAKTSPPISPDLHGHSKKKKHTLFGGKGRSRSESPERVPKSKKKSSKDSFEVAGHPLEAATSVKSLDKESGAASGVSEGDSAAANVLDIIKQYNKKDELVKSQPQPPGHDRDISATTQASKTTSKGNADHTASKEKVHKGKKKSSKGDIKKKEASSGRGLLGFFKRGKAHEEESAGKPPKKKAKKDKEKDLKSDDKKRSEPHQLTIKGRIERLKEIYTDGDEGTDSAPVVLLSVTKHEEDEQNDSNDHLTDRESGSPSPMEEEGEEAENPAVEEGVVFQGEEEEEVGEDLAQIDDGDEKRKEESENSDAVDRVKRLQSLFQSQDTVSSRALL